MTVNDEIDTIACTFSSKMINSMAKIGLGDEKVQAMDYAYTIQGWVKGVNSDALIPGHDIGKDADLTVGNINKMIARDAFGYSLGYYEGDYTPIGFDFTGTYPLDYAIAKTAGSALIADASDLFNGNISHMVTTLTDPTTNITKAQGTAYKYDQLNRIKRMRAQSNLDYGNNEWPTGSDMDVSYDEDYQYDANGSITHLTRNGLAGINAGAMDDLTYHYNKPNGKKISNRLLHISDDVPDGTPTPYYTDDMDDQGTFDLGDPTTWNYHYDQTGNLISDHYECIQNIEWTVYGKVKKVTRIPGCLTETTAMPDLEFNYDATGNMVEKIVKPAVTLADETTWLHTYYVHDASGNIMATYEKEGSDFTLAEQQLYGSSHIGTSKRNLDLISPPAVSNTFTRTLGQKQFFLSDHRGNNNVTVSDRKIPVEEAGNTGIIAYYEPDIVRAVDYYPFGREMNGRIWDKDESEFGYNGKQKIKEWSARLGGAVLYGDRIYLPGCGCFVSVDKLQAIFSYLSPYSYASNVPIIAVDINGLQPEYIIDKVGNVTEPVITLLNAALDYEEQPMRQSTWSYYKDTKFGRFWMWMTGYPTATVAGTDVYHDASGLNDIEWLGLVSHEESHRQDISDQGNWNFYTRYLAEGARKKYRDIPTEKKAYKFGSDVYNSNDLTDLLLKFNNGEVIKTLQDENLTYFEKSTILKRVGLEFKAIVVLPQRINDITMAIGEMEKGIQTFSGSPQELEFKQNVLDISKMIRDNLVKELKTLQGEISKNKPEIRDKGSATKKEADKTPKGKVVATPKF